jgi:hypothetical protein
MSMRTALARRGSKAKAAGQRAERKRAAARQQKTVLS